MNNKFSQWTITIIDDHGYMASIEIETKDEVLERLKEMHLEGFDMDYVNVYPPKSNLTLEEIINY